MQISKIKKERGDITMDLTEINWVTRGYYKELYAYKLDSLD